MALVFPEVTGIKGQRSLQVTGVQRAAAEADGAAHHSRQSQDSQQDDPPMSLHPLCYVTEVIQIENGVLQSCDGAVCIQQATHVEFVTVSLVP